MNKTIKEEFLDMSKTEDKMRFFTLSLQNAINDAETDARQNYYTTQHLLSDLGDIAEHMRAFVKNNDKGSPFEVCCDLLDNFTTWSFDNLASGKEVKLADVIHAAKTAVALVAFQENW